MQYKQRVYIPSMLPEGDAQIYVGNKRTRFVTEALTESGYLKDGGFVTLRYSEARGPSIDHYAEDVDIVQMSVELEPVKQYKTVYRAPEEIYLPPERSLKAKLKNCLAYLRDKTGGTIETEEVESC